MSGLVLRVKRILLHLHIRHRKGEEKKFKKKYPSRRWVVKRTNSWHNRFKILFTRYEKKEEENYLGLVQVAISIIFYRTLILGIGF
jgi:putative transposase